MATTLKERLLRSTRIPHKPVRLNFKLPSKTRQEFAKECDINNIIKQFTQTGLLPQQNKTPQYLDLANLPDLQTSLHIISAANTAFMTLPANVRKEFDNNPVKFANFAVQKENLEQLRKWGLAPPEPTPAAPQRVEIVNPQPADEPDTGEKKTSKK